MPKFLTSCHYNEEEISRHLKNNIGYRQVQINGNKYATGQILKKPVEVVKGRISDGWAQKSPEPWCGSPFRRIPLIRWSLIFPQSLGFQPIHLQTSLNCPIISV